MLAKEQLERQLGMVLHCLFLYSLEGVTKIQDHDNVNSGN